jgi:hypothetical protein
MKHIALLITALALFAAPLGGGLFGGDFGQAQAQKAKREKPQKPKTRRSEVLGKAAFQRIEQSQMRLGEEKYIEAFAPLQAILDSERFKPYEKAVAIQTMGFIYAAQGKYAKTIETFERAVATGHLPARVVSDITYNLAQLYLAEGQGKKSLALLEQWFAGLEGEPSAGPFALRAQIYLGLDNLAAAEKDIRLAISKAEAPKQQWTRILLSVLLQQARYKEARPILETAVERWPGVKTFWQQLTAVYYDADDEKLAFVAQQAMHVQGMLSSSKELSSMAQLYLYHDVPIKAAQVLQSGMDAGKIEKTEKNYELLAQSYRHAREWKASMAPLTKAAKKSDKGKFYEQLAQSHLQDEQWAKAEAALEKALEKGQLEKPADTWLLLGIARVRTEKYDAAIKAFRKAGDDDDTARDAFRWIRSIERRLAEKRNAKSDG